MVLFVTRYISNLCPVKTRIHTFVLVLNSNRHTLWQLHLPPFKPNKETSIIHSLLTVRRAWVAQGPKTFTDQDIWFRLSTSVLIHIFNTKSHSQTNRQCAPCCWTKLSKSETLSITDLYTGNRPEVSTNTFLDIVWFSLTSKWHV